MVKIPDKMYFTIGEVSDLCGLEPFVLRYWQTEFGQLRPSKSPRGQRMYQKKDIEAVLRIKKLLYEEKFTIDGARKRLKELRKEDKVTAVDKAVLLDVKKQLVALKKLFQPTKYE